MTDCVSLSQFTIIKIEGPDATSFLQGQVSCDVTKLNEDNWIAGCHCNAKGKMWSTFIAKKIDQAIYLIALSDSAAASLAEFNKYGVFAKAEFTDDTENWYLYGSAEPLDEEISFELASNHFLTMSTKELAAGSDNGQWWFNEILSGRAHIPQPLIGEYVPQMLNLQALDYISFNKGCYMGQETIARMRYLGKNKRALYIAKSDSELQLEPGQDVYIAMNGNRRSQGKVINFSHFDGQTAVQLVLPKDLEVQPIYINTEDDTALTLVDLPYTLE